MYKFISPSFSLLIVPLSKIHGVEKKQYCSNSSDCECNFSDWKMHLRDQ